MNGNRIIVHGLIKTNEGYLVTKRSKIETTFPEYWDIPGGLAELGELPKDALTRETKEEVGLDVVPLKVIHEDSNYDKDKNMVFIRLVYLCDLKSDIADIVLEESEHSEYRFINSILELENENISPFLVSVFNNL